MNRKKFLEKCVKILNSDFRFSHINEVYSFLMEWAKLMKLEGKRVKFMKDHADAMVTLATSGFINFGSLVKELEDKGEFQIIEFNKDGKIEYFIVDNNEP